MKKGYILTGNFMIDLLIGAIISAAVVFVIFRIVGVI